MDHVVDPDGLCYCRNCRVENNELAVLLDDTGLTASEFSALSKKLKQQGSPAESRKRTPQQDMIEPRDETESLRQKNATLQQENLMLRQEIERLRRGE